MEKNKVFTYGTLKKGFYNHKTRGFDENTTFIKKAKLIGAQMYNLGYYPCIVLTGNDKDIIQGEIYEYKTKDSYTELGIRSMELGSGYVEKEVIIDGMNVKVYIFEQKPKYGTLIKSGIWE